MEYENSRWKCPETDCGSLDVEVALPYWYRETTDHVLIPIGVDEAADPLWFVCNTCETSGQGQPTRVEG